MDYLVVVHLDPSAPIQPHVRRQLSALGLNDSSPNCGHGDLPQGTLVGVCSGSSARALRRRVQAEVRMAVGPRARAAVCVGRHPSLPSMTSGQTFRLAA